MRLGYKRVLKSVFIAIGVARLSTALQIADWPRSACADESSATSTAQTSNADGMSYLENHSWRIYGGAAAGYGNVSGQEYVNAPDGPQYLLDGDLSFQTSHLVYELGGGWMYSKLSGSDGGALPLVIRTRSGFGDASVRYRLSQNWQLGPAYNLDFGTDTRFGSTIGESRNTSLLGLRVVYELALGQIPFRIQSEALTSVGDGNRNYVLATLGFQIGLPLVGNSNTRERDIVVSSAASVRAPLDAQSTSDYGKSSREVRITLDPKKVFFSTDSAQIKPEVRKVLHEVADYLATHDNTWGSVELSGHADQRGSAAYNLKLSRVRAQSVYSVLVEQGVKEEKVGVESYGFSKPLDPSNNPQAWAENRRVELIFQNVKDPFELKRQLEKLSRFQTALPLVRKDTVTQMAGQVVHRKHIQKENENE